jgi:hypothetical protein
MRSTMSEPDALHATNCSDQRHQKSDPAEQDDRAKIFTEKIRRFFQLGDDFDEGGHGNPRIVVVLKKRSPAATSDSIFAGLTVLRENSIAFETVVRNTRSVAANQRQ